jgi:very-short-patch-repair endonuclease
VSIEQLRSAGLSQDAVKRRVNAGRLHRVYRGIYAVGHSGLSSEGRWMAAVLSLGQRAALSHRSAAELWAMLPPKAGPVHVVVPDGGGRQRRKGIRLHRCPSLPSSAMTERLGITVTSPSRTIADLRRAATADEVQTALREAQYRRLDVSDKALREPELTRSVLERRFLRLCRRYGLPRPQVNALVGPYEVDFLWRDHKLVVETDGWRAHGGRLAFEEDRARDLELRLLGYEVVRFTYRQVMERPAMVVEKLAILLRRPIR